MNELIPTRKNEQEANWIGMLAKASNYRANEITPIATSVNPLLDRIVNVGWLHQQGVDYSKINRLINRCSSVGFIVERLTGVETIENVTAQLDLILQADLILLEAFGRHGRENYEQVVLAVRRYSGAPLVLLTEDAAPENSIRALKVGADAVLLLVTPEEVIIARLQALLRRWMDKKSKPN